MVSESSAIDRSPRTTALVAAAVLSVLALHVLTSWGYIGLYWGDSGRWLYEVDRYAHGARLYRDVYWGFPPLGMWVVGGVTRVIGSDLAQMWAVTLSIAALLGVTYAIAVTRLLPTSLALLAAPVGMALGTVYSSTFSPPLVSGMYSPAVPVAVLVFFVQVVVFLRDWSRPSLMGAALVGAVGGAAILTKHDVWFASFVLMGSCALAAPHGGQTRAARVCAVAAALVVVLGAGLTLLAAQHGIGSLGRICGFGRRAGAVMRESTLRRSPLRDVDAGVL